MAALVLAGAGVVGTPAAAAAEPFGFLVTPTDQLAVPGEAAGTEITPEGHLYTGYAELVFGAGPRLRALRGATRTLAGGRYPVISSGRSRAGVHYRITAFAAPVAGQPVNFVRVRMRNVDRRPRLARFATGIRHGPPGDSDEPPRFRFRRPAEPERPGLYFQPGERFDPGARYALTPEALTRDGRALYFLGRPPPGVRVRRRIRADGGRGPARPYTVFGFTTYAVRLAPGRTVALDLKMPVRPLSRDEPAFKPVRAAAFAAHRARTIAYWRGVLAPAMRIELPEAKVEDAFYAALVTAAQARYRTATGEWVQAVNKLQYHAFYLRDAAVITNSFDLAGLHRLARENLDFFPSWQRSDGLFISRAGQYDGHGQALWAIGEHVRRTGDLGYARAAFPPVSRAVDWLARARREDRLGLVPAGDPGDNELVAGHLAGDNFWAVAGLERAVELARRLGESAAAERWAAELAALRASLEAHVRRAAGGAGGRIPPALDAPGGQDWGNLWASYPVAVLAPGDPAVEATIRGARSRFREGIATYLDGRLLHHYLGFRVLQTELLRGEQERVVQGLYDALAHTTATHGGFETGVHPYGSRSVDDNMTPHGWYAAEYVALVRNILVREEGGGLVLMSALPRGWLRPGRVVSVRRAPTDKGRVAFTLRAREGGALLSWRAAVAPGTRLAWRLPPGARSVRARGLSADRRTIVLPGPEGRLEVSWRLPHGGASYARSVRRLLAGYRARGR